MPLNKKKEKKEEIFSVFSLFVFLFYPWFIGGGEGRSPRDVVALVPHCDTAGCEFKLQSRYYVHFRINTHRVVMNLITPLNYELNNTSIFLL